MRGTAALSLLSLAIAACGGKVAPEESATTENSATCRRSATAGAEVASVRMLGEFPKIPGVRTFSGGSSTRIGGDVLWTFAEAVLENDPSRTVSSFAGVAGIDEPLQPSVIHDGDAPRELVPLTDEERAFNITHKNERIVIWPSGAIAVAGFPITFWTKFLVRPGFLDFEQMESGFAHVSPTTRSAVDRVTLFHGTAPAFGIGPLVHDGLVYSWACVEGGCVLGRAPIAELADPSAWRVRSGDSWSTDLASGTQLFTGPPGSLSMSFNKFLGKFLVVHSEAFTNRVVMRTADQPEGPWSQPVLAFETEQPDQYAGQEQPALASECGETILITYFGRTNRTDVDYEGHIRAVEVTLR
jgi:hypothetical protein